MAFELLLNEKTAVKLCSYLRKRFGVIVLSFSKSTVVDHIDGVPIFGSKAQN